VLGVETSDFAYGLGVELGLEDPVGAGALDVAGAGEVSAARNAGIRFPSPAASRAWLTIATVQQPSAGHALAIAAAAAIASGPVSYGPNTVLAASRICSIVQQLVAGVAVADAVAVGAGHPYNGLHRDGAGDPELEADGAGHPEPEADGAGDPEPEADGAGDPEPEADGAGDPELEADDTTAIAAATPALSNTATTPAITVIRARYSLGLFMLFLLSRDRTCPAGALTRARKSCPALDRLPPGWIGYGQHAGPQRGCLSPSQHT
jgi:hypothetical protein